jgi:5-methylcytosine-specific restriction protein A
MLSAGRLAEILTDRFGVSVSGEAIDDSDGKRAIFRPLDLQPTQGFSVEVLIGWRTVEVQFVPGTYAAGLLASMGTANPDQRAALGAFIRSAMNDGARVTFRINNQDVDPLQPVGWPGDWRSLGLAMAWGPAVIDDTNPTALDSLALTWSSRLLGTVLALMPLEPVLAESTGEAEGGGQQVVVTQYERSHINRAACIEIHGIRCKVCGFDFASVYGAIGEGFIEVHHIDPVSGIAPGTIVDPAKDLAPVCPNCHAMLHRRKPPYSIDELRSMLPSVLFAGGSMSSGLKVESGPEKK